MLASGVLLLSLTIYHEGRNQPLICQQYIADTVVNRMDKRNMSAERVIKEKGQYKWINHINSKKLEQNYKHIQLKGAPADKEALVIATKIAKKVLSDGYVPINQGSYFQTTNKKVPKYYKGVFKCGNHYFSKYS